MAKIIDAFSITDRGTVILLDSFLNLPVGTKLIASIQAVNGLSIQAEANKEYLLRRKPIDEEVEAFLLLNIDKSEVPIGSSVYIKIASN